jgi:hypothetical protein
MKMMEGGIAARRSPGRGGRSPGQVRSAHGLAHWPCSMPEEKAKPMPAGREGTNGLCHKPFARV